MQGETMSKSGEQGALDELLGKQSPEMRALFVKTINHHAGHQIKERSESEVLASLMSEIEKIVDKRGK